MAIANINIDRPAFPLQKKEDEPNDEVHVLSIV